MHSWMIGGSPIEGLEANKSPKDPQIEHVHHYLSNELDPWSYQAAGFNICSNNTQQDP